VIETLAQVLGETAKGPFAAGLVLWGDGGDGDVVVEAAPIIGYMKKQGWTKQQVRSYVGMRKHKGWSVSVVHQINREQPTWWTIPPKTTRAK
jgi:hypothetical protein